MGQPLLTRFGIEESHERIRDSVHLTPVLTSRNVNAIAGCSLFFKCENFQRVGAFKIRGATNTVRLISADSTEQLSARGVATHSSGNHAQAVALAAREMGLPAHIVMPSTSPAVKVRAVEGYGARITECGPTQSDREEMMATVLAQTGAEFIHPYDDERVIAGQATAAKELVEQVAAMGSQLDVIVGPVGGGGLMSGTSLAAAFFSPRTRVIGAEPEGADDAARSFRSGSLQKNETVATIADGLRTNLSQQTFSILRRHLADIITVTDLEIMNALRIIYERLKIVVEPSAAVPLAALLRQHDTFAGKRVGVILSGGNADFGALFGTPQPADERR